VAIIGAGLGGLSCAAVLAAHGYAVTVCESHSIAGGAAHGFEQDGFHFDSGPSFFSGLAMDNSFSPVKQILDMVGERVRCVQYPGWNMHIPEGTFYCPSEAAGYRQEVRRLTSEKSAREWDALLARMKPLGTAVEAVPTTSLRSDLGALLTSGPFALRAGRAGRALRYMQKPFGQLVQEEINDPLIRNLLDLECFMLSGMLARETVTAEMAFMFTLRERAPIDYPIGGSQAIVDALVRGIEKHGGQVRTGQHVERIEIEGGRATGIELRRGGVLRARKAVVSNASIWDTLGLIPEGDVPDSFRQERAATPQTDSFMHLHLGIDGTGLEDLKIHQIVVNHWDLEAAQNVVGISIPTAVDPSVAPPGKHLIHAYTPATEPFDLWEGLRRGTAPYESMKAERSEVLWKALERIIPDVRDRAELVLVGSPLTHKRYLRRDRGTYGAAMRAGETRFSDQRTPVEGLWLAGDSVNPGIGVPAAAMSGMIAAHSILPVWKHATWLARSRMPDWLGLGLSPRGA